MKAWLFELSDAIIYLTGLCWMVAGIYSGVQLIANFGELTRFMIAGVLAIIFGVLACALHCLICFAIVDIRSYTRHSAKMLNSSRG